MKVDIRCPICCCELSYCGEIGKDGVPTLDCALCRCKDRIREQHAEIDRLRTTSDCPRCEKPTDRFTIQRQGMCQQCAVEKIEQLAECRRLLREACDHMDDTADGWAEDWIKRAAAAGGGDD